MNLLKIMGEFFTDLLAVCGMLAVILMLAATIVTGIVCCSDIRYNQCIRDEVCGK